jgi:hypothetical protein
LGFFSSAITMVLQQSEQAPHCFPTALIGPPRDFQGASWI